MWNSSHNELAIVIIMCVIICGGNQRLWNPLECSVMYIVKIPGIFYHMFIFIFTFRGRKRFVSEGDGGTVKDPEY